MDYITLSMGAIITIALFVIFSSFWITDLADKDAQSINLSGSMRMQTYHIGLALEENDRASANSYIAQLHQTWNNPLFTSLHKGDKHDVLSLRFNEAYSYWLTTLRPTLQNLTESNQPINTPIDLLEHQVELTNKLVNQFQQDAELKIRQLRTFQLVAFFTTIIVGSLIYHQLKNRIERPLKQLTEASKAIGEGNFNQRTDISGSDELGLLGAVFNQMTDSLADMYADLEKRVKERTQELEKNNITLKYLFNNAKRILNSYETPLNYEELINELDEIINTGSIELCLFTAEGKKPYLHTIANRKIKDCGARNCENCLSKSIEINEKDLILSHHFNIKHHDFNYGVITVKADHLDHWQRQLLKSTADQMAIAISLSEQKTQEQRLAMLNERTVIARELHDSLAQALSYLQIQVTLLEKTQEKQKYDKQTPIINELKGGLSSAYRQLRELLTTFRLKIDSGGLKAALQASAEDLKNRSNMEVSLDYGLSDIPLNSADGIVYANRP